MEAPLAPRRLVHHHHPHSQPQLLLHLQAAALLQGRSPLPVCPRGRRRPWPEFRSRFPPAVPDKPRQRQWDGNPRLLWLQLHTLQPRLSGFCVLSRASSPFCVLARHRPGAQNRQAHGKATNIPLATAHHALQQPGPTTAQTCTPQSVACVFQGTFTWRTCPTATSRCSPPHTAQSLKKWAHTPAGSRR